jgi:5,10-methylene-tetrahydrofolate dehydrogenase/methenyl tetrahydrofolate cyclohydrolase
MTAKIISGSEVAKEIREELRQEVAELKEKHNLTPGLVTILVGEDPASVSYVTAKQRTSHELGFYSKQDNQPADMAEDELLKLIDQYNSDPKIHGILVQLPLPKHIDEGKILYAIDPRKDVDGFHPVNVGNPLGDDHRGFRSGGCGPEQHRGRAHRQYPLAEEGRGQRNGHDLSYPDQGHGIPYEEGGYLDRRCGKAQGRNR